MKKHKKQAFKTGYQVVTKVFWGNPDVHNVGFGTFPELREVKKTYQLHYEEKHIMGDRSPKDKMKKKAQHDKDVKKHNQQKQENMLKNRKDTGQTEQEGDQYKKAG